MNLLTTLGRIEGMEARAKISWSGTRHGKEEAMGFFSGIANDCTDHNLEMTKFIASGDSVAVFERLN